MVDAIVQHGAGSYTQTHAVLKTMVLVSAATLPFWVAVSGAQPLAIFGATLLAVFAFFALLLGGGGQPDVSDEEFDLGVEASVNNPHDSVSRHHGGPVRDAA